VAAQRDASWHNHPALRAGRFYVVVGDWRPARNQKDWGVALI
jgi:hypothetical protein